MPNPTDPAEALAEAAREFAIWYEGMSCDGAPKLMGALAAFDASAEVRKAERALVDDVLTERMRQDGKWGAKEGEK